MEPHRVQVRTGGRFGAALMLLYGCRACLLLDFQGENGNRNPQSIGKILPVLRVSSFHCILILLLTFPQLPWDVLNGLHGIFFCFHLLRKDTFSQKQGNKVGENITLCNCAKTTRGKPLRLQRRFGALVGAGSAAQLPGALPIHPARPRHRPPRAGKDERSPWPERCARS